MNFQHQFSSLRVTSLLFGAIGCAIIACFAVDQLVPLWASGAVFLVSAIAIFYFLIAGEVRAISFLLYGFIALPFVHLLPYLFFDPNQKPSMAWGLAPNPYTFDIETIKLTAELGAAGVSGLLAGMFAAYAKPEKKDSSGGHYLPTRTLNFFWFFGLLTLALVASKLAAPSKTIFEAEYIGSGTMAESLNFGSLGLVSYSILILCFADVIFDQDRRRRVWKLAALVATILYIVIWLQFARGDRESIPMVIACAVLFWIWGAPRFAHHKSKLIALRVLAAASIVGIVAAGFVLQELRQRLAGKGLADVATVIEQTYVDVTPPPRHQPAPPESKFATFPAESKVAAVPDESKVAAVPAESKAAAVPTDIRGPSHFERIDRKIPSGTWSAVLLTPLSVAGDSLRGLLPLRLGRTYLDFILSIPPGFVADRLGYHRPIDADHGPAHEMRYGQGGTHAVVVPFMNFRMVGVVAILAALGWLFATVERHTSHINPPWTVQKVAAFGIICTMIPQWIWYGEKILITSFFIWFGLSVVYHLTVTRMQRDRFS
jgi:hypothetical protein